jgi:hypothetical protein
MLIVVSIDSDLGVVYLTLPGDICWSDSLEVGLLIARLAVVDDAEHGDMLLSIDLRGADFRFISG